MLASIPSPSSGVVHLGPLLIHMYGVMLLLGIAAAVWLGGSRWVRWGGDWDLILRAAVWGVAGGVIGGRLYHDLTSWNEVPDSWWGFAAVWRGGLGIWGAIPGGVLAGCFVWKRAGQSIRLGLDALAPGLLLAQGIGRWGNWWNQELYGKHTTLPWGLEIHGKGAANLYHPTFLYESVWDALMVGVLLLVDRRFRIKRPALFALYVSLYTAFRTFEETLRIDPSKHYAGERLNFWVSLAAFVVSTAFFVWWQFVRTGNGDVRRARRVPSGPAMAIPKSRTR